MVLGWGRSSTQAVRSFFDAGLGTVDGLVWIADDKGFPGSTGAPAGIVGRCSAELVHQQVVESGIPTKVLARTHKNIAKVQEADGLLAAAVFVKNIFSRSEGSRF